MQFQFTLALNASGHGDGKQNRNLLCNSLGTWAEFSRDFDCEEKSPIVFAVAMKREQSGARDVLITKQSYALKLKILKPLKVHRERETRRISLLQLVSASFAFVSHFIKIESFRIV